MPPPRIIAPAAIACPGNPGARSIAACFEEMASRHPDRTAIRTHQGELSYSQLNAQANRIAQTILAMHGPEPGRIALVFGQGADAIAAILGVLKSGHAFVPIDAAEAGERMRAILRDCRPTALLTTNDQVAVARPSADAGIDIITVDQWRSTSNVRNPGLPVSPDAMAYLFYTSGSTGQPKGVIQTHRNLLHFVRTYSNTLSITTADRLSLLYSLSFSASNMDVFGALLNGATLCPYDIRRRGTSGLADWLDQESITVLHAVPTLFRHLTTNLPPARRLDRIRAIDLGGETVSASDIKLYQDHFPKNCALINHLAATEASVLAQYRIDPDRDATRELLPVGHPAAGINIRIVRNDGTDADIAEPGEMVVHSPFLSPGYWGRPDLTSAAFGEDAQRPGWRIFRSRDLGYLGPDGLLYFLGRKDSRVKIRGHTVDTSEVEAALRETSGIFDVAVVCREAPRSGDPGQLVAYLIAQGQRDGGRPPSADTLRQSLRAKLPAYMIPSQYVILESLPVTPSGKIDRQALSGLDPQESRERRPCEAPVGALEHQIAGLFEKLLHHHPVGRADDFFRLGGDSLKATQLHLHLEDLIGRRIPLESLFQDPTVAGLARFVLALPTADPAEPSQPPPILIPLSESGSNPILFLMHGAKGQAFVSPHFLSILGNDQPVYAFQASGLDRARVPHNTIEEMAAEYVRALRGVQPSGPYFLGALCAGALLIIEMARELRQAGETVGPLLLIDPPVVPPGELPPAKRRKRLRRMRLRSLFFRLLSHKKTLGRLRRRANQGRIALDAGDARSMETAARVALDMSIALLKYKLAPYDGPALILRSAERLAGEGGSDHGKLSRHLVGPVQVFEVGAKHGDVHEVDNELFARQLQRSVRIALEAMADSSASNCGQ